MKQLSFFFVSILITACSTTKEQAVSTYYLITDFGADTSLENNAPFIQEALNTANKNGGGIVWVPAGLFRSGSIILPSNTTLHLSKGSILKGLDSLSSYKEVGIKSTANKTHPNYGFIIAQNAENISITGEGNIDGNGLAEVFACYPIPNDPTGAWHKPPRPAMVRFFQCENVTLKDFMATNGATWGVHLEECMYVNVDGLNIFNHSNANNDGLDIDGCKEVTISNCIIDADDDAIVLKSKGSIKPCENVVVSNCILASKTNALKTGTESRGGFKNISVSNIQIRPSLEEKPYDKNRTGENFCGICLAQVDGGRMENISIDGVQISGSPNPIFVRLGNRNRPLKTEKENKDTSVMRNIYLSNIYADTCGKKGMLVSGTSTTSIENIRLSDIHVVLPGGYKKGDSINPLEDRSKTYPYAGVFGDKPYPAKGITFRYTKGVHLSNVVFNTDTPDPRPDFYYIESN